MMSNQQKGLPKQGGPANKKHSRKMGGWDVIAIKGQKPSCILELESCCSAFVALQLFQLYCIWGILVKLVTHQFWTPIFNILYSQYHYDIFDTILY